jgi:hypothetical protein
MVSISRKARGSSSRDRAWAATSRRRRARRLPPRSTEPPDQLYHLGDDLGETRNLYVERPEIVARLTALLE